MSTFYTIASQTGDMHAVSLSAGHKLGWVPPMGDLDLMGLGLLACAIRGAEEISATWKQLSTDPVFARFGRLSEVFALPLAVHRVMVGEDNRALLGWVMNTQAAELATETVSDEQDLVQTILMAIPPGGGPPLAYYLEKIHIGRIQTAFLEGVGIRKLPGDDNRIFIVSRGAKPATDGRTKTGHFETKEIRSLPGFPDICREVLVRWRINSRWRIFKQFWPFMGTAGRAGGSPASWASTAGRSVVTCAGRFKTGQRHRLFSPV